jgi:hypothetical protein
LKDYFESPPDSTALFGPGKSEETALVVIVGEPYVFKETQQQSDGKLRCCVFVFLYST